MAAVLPAPAAGIAPVPVAILPLLPPAVPHVFTRCTPLGMDPEQDYLRVPMVCGVYNAFPNLGWVDVSGAYRGQAAAPALALQLVLGAPMHLDWGTPAADAMLRLPELTVMVDLVPLGRFADALEGLGLFNKAYPSSRAFLDALEMALPRCPSPSPFLLGVGELIVLSTFISLAVPAVVAVLGVAAAAAIPAVVAVAAVAAVVAAPATPAVPAVPAVRARNGRPAVPAIPAVPAVPAVRARAAVPAVLASPAVPAVRAVRAVPGRVGIPAGAPSDLEWFHLVRLSARVDQNSLFPFLPFLRTGVVALDRCSQTARADPNSLVRAVTDSLRAGTLAHSRATTLGNAALAQQFPPFAATMELLPSALRTHSFDSAVLGREMLDAISFAGDLAMQDAVTSARLHLISHDYPSAHDFLARSPGVSSKVSVIRALAPLGLGHRAGVSLFDCLEIVDALLLKHTPFLNQAWNKNLAVLEVVRLLKIEAAEWTAAGGADTAGADKGADVTSFSRASVSLQGVTDAALRRATLESDAFLGVVAEIEELDLETNEGRSSALEAALLSGLTIFQRFFANPKCLATRHTVFAALTLCLSEMPAYLGRAQAASLETNEVAELRAGWLFHKDQCDKLFRGRISEIAWFSGPHGALALLNLDASEPFEDCPADQLFVVETVLSEMISFVRPTMLAAGWAAESSAGYTLVALFERQLAHLQWIRKQGGLEIATLLPHAQKAFVAALLECEATHERMLAHPQPALAKLDFHIAFDGPYDRELKTKTAGAAPIILLRRAFPGLLPASTPRSLAGVVLPAAAGPSEGGGGSEKKDGGKKGGGGRGGDGGGGKGGGGRGGDGGGGGGRGGGAGAVKAPGSLSAVATWPDATHMRLGDLIYDTAAIAKHYSLDADHCFPVLLSTKKGGHALALCQHWGEPGHTALSSGKHVIPKQWNYTHVCSHMAVKVDTTSGAGKKRKK